MRVPEVIVAGHICLDITPAFSPTGAATLAELLRPGHLTHVGAADVHTGGCVANTGLALQKLGVATRLIARVGDDVFAGLIRQLLEAEGADCPLVCDPASSTSYSVVLAPPGIDRVFLHNPGANEGFAEADVTDAMMDGARLMHFGYPPLMLRLCRDGGAELLRLFARAKARGLATSLDLCAVDASSPAATMDWPALLARLLPSVDFFLPSAEELCFMLDRPRLARWLARSGGDDVTAVLDIRRDIAPLGDRLLELGCKVAVIKCGARGLYYRTAGPEQLRGAGLPLAAEAWADREGFQPAFRPERIVSATGAGDTSIAAFLATALEGQPLERCVARAAAIGACCVEAYDALGGLRPFAELDKRIAGGWPTAQDGR